jgi:Regulator of chromosome condensation (RCC1) repeat
MKLINGKSWTMLTARRGANTHRGAQFVMPEVVTDPQVEWTNAEVRPIALRPDAAQLDSSRSRKLWTRVGAGVTLLLSAALALPGDALAHSAAVRVHASVSRAGSSFTQVATGDDYDCGLKTTGRVVCWGYLPAGLPNAVAGLPGPSGSFSQISVGAFTGCGVHPDGSVACWGDGPVHPVLASPTGSFRQISVGGGGSSGGTVPPAAFYNHPFACGITLRFSIFCWGDSTFGQAQPPPGRFSQVSAGQTAACAVAMNSNVACWGQGAHKSMKPPTGKFTQVTLGDTQAASFDFQVGFSGSYACAVTVLHAVTCWGGEKGYRPYARAPSGSFSSISAGDTATCGVNTASKIVCWGYFPPGVSPLPDWTFSQVSVGEVVCGVRTGTGAIACAYNNDVGESDVFTGPAKAISGDFSSSIGSACILGRSGLANCWRLPNGPGRFTKVSVFGRFACGIRSNGSLACWGSDDTHGASPPAGSFTQVTVGDNGYDGYGCAIRSSDRSLTCWPVSAFPQSMRTPPAGPFRQVSLSKTRLFACGVRPSGTAVCWGNDSAGETHPPPGKFTEVSAGDGYACGIRLNKTVTCWGDNRDGIQQVPTGSFKQVVAGSSLSTDYACALRVAGKLTCWGQPSGPYFGETAGAPPQGKYSQVIAGEMPCALTTTGSEVVCWSEGGEIIPLQ